MTIEFTPHAWEEYQYWIDTDIDTAQRIGELIKDITRDPFRGMGKPEPLKHGLQGYWSRRITDGDRLVYKVSGKKGVVLVY